MPEIASITDTREAALPFVFLLGGTQWKHNRKEKYSLGFSICTLPELWVLDQTRVNKFTLLAGIGNKQELQVHREDGS